MVSQTRWVWLDMEMSGLDPARHKILEMATVITDEHLNVVAEGPDMVAWQPPEVLDAMDDWCTEQHGKSGLTARVQNSTNNVRDIERATMEFLEQHIAPNTAPICGNSVWQDKRFLYRYMPEVSDFCHYRIIDVSSLKILSTAWLRPSSGMQLRKARNHRAKDDVYESIEELKYYREMLFVPAARRDK
ncbi:MAG: oligoribonuclease [Gammaproteobacteria bacterium]